MVSSDSDPIYSILYIDDEENNLTSFKSTFRRDYRIHVASSGAEGLEIMEKHSIQLVITDQRMPDMTGIEFLEQIVPLYPDCMRMIMTGYSDLEAVIQAINKGNIYRYVSKPWNREDLKITIDSALEVYNLKSQNKQLIDGLKEANQNLELKVIERTRQIEQQRLNITDSLHYARRIQKALMLPSEELEKILPSHPPHPSPSRATPLAHRAPYKDPTSPTPASRQGPLLSYCPEQHHWRRQTKMT